MVGSQITEQLKNIFSHLLDKYFWGIQTQRLQTYKPVRKLNLWWACAILQPKFGSVWVSAGGVSTGGFRSCLFGVCEQMEGWPSFDCFFEIPAAIRGAVPSSHLQDVFYLTGQAEETSRKWNLPFDIKCNDVANPGKNKVMWRQPEMVGLWRNER